MTNTITASDVNKLRQQTGLGMMDCKNALVESGGDFEKAIEILRKKGQKVATKRSDKEAKEGFVLAKTSQDGKRGILLALNCETDFVAKTEPFIKLVENIAEAALKHNPVSIDELKGLSFSGNGTSIGERIIEEIGKIGEKIDVSVLHSIEAARVVAYNHPGNKIATIVGVNIDVAADAVATVQGEKILNATKDVAMQVAAMSPIALDKNDVPKEVIEKEIEIGKEQARTEGKPEAMLEKIALGKLNKFYKEVTLLNQEFIKDNKKTVAQYLKDTDKELTVTAFKRVSLL